MNSLPHAAASAGYAIIYTSPHYVEVSGVARSKSLSHPLNQCVVLSMILSFGAGPAITCRKGKAPLVIVYESVECRGHATSSASPVTSLFRPCMESVVDYDTNVGAQGAEIYLQ